MPGSDLDDAHEWPKVTIVFLVYNRREELRTSLRRMLADSDYPSDRIETIVVDNASTDGSSAMVADEFPQVRILRHARNVGVSGWNVGLAQASGDYVLILDDDCYLRPDGLRQAVIAARDHHADLVSFRVVSDRQPDHAFTDKYVTGVFMFWGCAVLVTREVIDAVGGYDPEIFFLANELEFTLRVFDAGFRHLHLPEVVAEHMKDVPPERANWIDERGYRTNHRHWGYIAGKLFAPRHALMALFVLMAGNLRDGLRIDRVAFKGGRETLRGFVHGLRHRAPLRNRELAPFYLANFETFAAPWTMARPLRDLIRELPGETRSDGVMVGQRDRPGERRTAYLQARAAYYPDRATILEFRPEPSLQVVAVGDQKSSRTR